MIIVKQLTIFALAVSIVLGCGYMIGGDRYLPWVKKETVYASLHHAESIELETGGYSYKTYAVNSLGDKKFIHFEMEQLLAEGTYLKLQSKGNYTKHSEIIGEERIPSIALESLKH